MREKAKLILKLMESGLSLNEIQTELHMINTELSRVLKYIRDIGYNYTKHYSSDGKITAKINRSLNNPASERRSIRINVIDRYLRAIFISDLHIGSKFERPSLLRKVVNYASDNGCHVIFNGGDVVENIYPENAHPAKISTVEKQVSHFLRVTPFQPDLIYFTLYGNHDYKSIQDKGLDIARVIEDRRYDIPSLGYGECSVHLKDDTIALAHDLKKTSKNELPNNVSAIYRGHSHKSKTRDNKIIYIPCLSENVNGAYEYRPLVGFLDCEFVFYNKKIARINMKQLAIVRGEVRLANEETMILQPHYHDHQRLVKKNKNESTR